MSTSELSLSHPGAHLCTKILRRGARRAIVGAQSQSQSSLNLPGGLPHVCSDLAATLRREL